MDKEYRIVPAPDNDTRCDLWSIEGSTWAPVVLYTTLDLIPDWIKKDQQPKKCPAEAAYSRRGDTAVYQCDRDGGHDGHHRSGSGHYYQITWSSGQAPAQEHHDE